MNSQSNGMHVGHTKINIKNNFSIFTLFVVESPSSNHNSVISKIFTLTLINWCAIFFDILPVMSLTKAF